MLLAKVLPFACLLLTVSANDGKFSRSFISCSRSDPRLNECLLYASNDALNQLKGGIPELGLDSFDPLLTKDLVIDSTSSPNIRLVQKFQNIQIYQLSKSNITKFYADLNNWKMKLVSYTPVFEFLADYSMEGNLLMMPIAGRGRSNVTMTQLKIHHFINGEVETRDGEDYFNIVKYSTRIKPKRVYYDFDNLFNGDKTMSDAMNTMINENWRAVSNELRESVEQQFSDFIKKIANMFFDNVPIRKIFLP